MDKTFSFTELSKLVTLARINSLNTEEEQWFLKRLRSDTARRITVELFEHKKTGGKVTSQRVKDLLHLSGIKSSVGIAA